MIRMIDYFLPDAQSVREMALRADFADFDAPDGETYRRVWIGEVPGVREGIERAMGRQVEMLGMGFRLNYAGERPNHAIHSDMGWGKYAMVLYLSEGEGGTAFWRHKATGRRSFRAGDDPAVYADDWDDASKWDMRMLAPMKFNRACLYESELFHSRYPFEAFGDSLETGRLIAVAFYS